MISLCLSAQPTNKSWYEFDTQKRVGEDYKEKQTPKVRAAIHKILVLIELVKPVLTVVTASTV